MSKISAIDRLSYRKLWTIKLYLIESLQLQELNKKEAIKFGFWEENSNNLHLVKLKKTYNLLNLIESKILNKEKNNELV